MTPLPCIGKTDLFFPESNNKGSAHKTREAKSLCYSCPAQRNCLAGYLKRFPSHKHDIGIVGGTSSRDRRTIRETMQERGCSLDEAYNAWVEAKSTTARERFDRLGGHLL
mgnify:CR=1 FL=1